MALNLQAVNDMSTGGLVIRFGIAIGEEEDTADISHAQINFKRNDPDIYLYIYIHIKNIYLFIYIYVYIYPKQSSALPVNPYTRFADDMWQVAVPLIVMGCATAASFM